MNSDRLKSIIYKKAHGDNDISQKYYQLFYFERILERISKSNYKNKIILKGGLLLTSIFGDDERTTKDMDATIKGIPLTKIDVEEVFNEILNMDINDGVSFHIISIKDIRLEDTYGGYRLNILSKLDNNKTYISIELTTGDIITPKEIKYNYNSIFDDRKIPIMSYTLETVLAEKIHSIITKGLLNTRLKDYYDIYILMNTKNSQINNRNLIMAIQNTFRKRESKFDIEQFNAIINKLSNDDNMYNLWKVYVSKNTYARNVKYSDTIDAIKEIVEILESELIGV